MLYNRIEAEKIKNIETVIKLSRQKAIAKKPRNPHYNEALRIAKATWERYPCAAKGPLCRNLRKHFNGKVSVDRLDVWIKEAELQPPRPERYTSFVLVTE
ncbi:hypothetical protein O0466_000432 [Salmonella enterica]|nr:hypothetical protein [Salmonella enterica]HAU2957986.1 hypothetical protein [Salmonella enterica subsp. diarizonae]HCM1893419.1 hypothetical protein [Salmonella enterica subsp. diarizonae serovar 57:c:e,n,x,z15]EAX3524714.1 hypothetical protein [Salmonella enterica]EAY1317968.1 hypothetical protein [Salmonella enterica]